MSAVAFAGFLRRFEWALEQQDQGRSFACAQYAGNSRVWSRPGEEFIVDFLNVVKRSLSGPLETALFRWRYLLGADVRMVALKVNKPAKEVRLLLEALEVRLGRSLAAALRDGLPATSARPRQVRVSLRPPLARAA